MRGYPSTPRPRTPRGRPAGTTEPPAAGPGVRVVGDTGIEPVTSSVSGKRATAAPIARCSVRSASFGERSRWIRDSNPCIRLCRPLPRLSANPPCTGFGVRRPARADQQEDTRGCPPVDIDPGTDIRADDEIRTRDPHLGKVMRYRCATSACRSCCFLTSVCSLAVSPGAFAPRLDLEDCIRSASEIPNRAAPDLIAKRPLRVFPRETGPSPLVHPGVARVNGPPTTRGSATIVTRVVHKTSLRAIGAVGSALPSHGRGHRFESGIAHHHPRPVGRGFSRATRSSRV